MGRAGGGEAAGVEAEGKAAPKGGAGGAGGRCGAEAGAGWRTGAAVAVPGWPAAGDWPDCACAWRAAMRAMASCCSGVIRVPAGGATTGADGGV